MTALASQPAAPFLPAATAQAHAPASAVPAHAEPAVAVAGLGKTIDDKTILADIAFEIPPGRSVALLGANGAGKSTLLKVLATLIPRTSGDLRLFGRSVGRDTSVVRARLGLIGHATMLYRDLSARENLVLFGRLYGVADPASRAEAMLRDVGLGDRADDPIRTFSRGMAQRAAIARALMHDPDLLLADEPFAGLDAPSRHLLEEILRRLHDAGKTVVLASHDIEQSLDLAERTIVLRAGRLVLDAPSDRLDPGDVLREVTNA